VSSEIFPVLEKIVGLSCFSDLGWGQSGKAGSKIILPSFELLTHCRRLSLGSEEKLLTFASRREIRRNIDDPSGYTLPLSICPQGRFKSGRM
jgi:hypothetical protein